MSDKYVPGTDTVRHVYAGAPKLQNEPDGYRAGREAAFDRWLAAERRAAAAEYLRRTAALYRAGVRIDTVDKWLDDLAHDLDQGRDEQR